MLYAKRQYIKKQISYKIVLHCAKNHPKPKLGVILLLWFLIMRWSFCRQSF